MKESHIEEQTGCPMVYDEAERHALETFIQGHFGPYEQVLHELATPDIHVDMALIPPAPQREYYTLVTIGMGARPMAVPEALRAERLERAELAVCLPPDWQFDSEDKAWRWPIRCLEALTRLPGGEDTWLGWGHTVPHDGTYADNTGFSSVLLAEPALFFKEGEAPYCRLPGGDDVNFYQVVPLYPEELRFKIEHDAEALLDRLGDGAWVADNARENTCLPEREDESPAGGALSFRERADSFWDWFSRSEEKLAAMSEDRRAAAGKEAAALLAKGAARLGGGVTLSLPGRFTLRLCAGKDVSLLYLLPWLAGRLPDAYRKKWRVQPGRPGSRGRDCVVERETLRVEAGEVLASLEYDETKNRFTVWYYNDTLCDRDEEVAQDALRELLLNMLGETALYVYVEDVRRLPEREKGMAPLTELEQALNDALKAAGRETGIRADQQTCVYDFEPEENEELRFDVLVGAACFPDLIAEYYDDTPDSWRRLAARGAKAAFLAFTYDGEQEAMLDLRHELEQRLETDVLGLRGREDSIGLILGGAVGNQCVYIDVLLYDEPAFLAAVRSVLKDYPYDFYLSEFRQCCDLTELS